MKQAKHTAAALYTWSESTTQRLYQLCVGGQTMSEPVKIRAVYKHLIHHHLEYAVLPSIFVKKFEAIIES